MKRNNSLILVAALTGICMVSTPYCICGDIFYYKSMKEENQKWYRENYLNKAFSGTISYVDYKSDDSLELVFVLTDIYSKRVLTYGSICIEGDSPLRKAYRGDTIIKDSGVTLVTIRFLKQKIEKADMKWCNF